MKYIKLFESKTPALRQPSYKKGEIIKKMDKGVFPVPSGG